jgi:hypothetical protein
MTLRLNLRNKFIFRETLICTLRSWNVNKNKTVDVCDFCHDFVSLYYFFQFQDF